MLSIAKLGAGGQRYYLDQAKARVDHRESVASGVEDYYLAAPEAPGVWIGAEAGRIGLAGRIVTDDTLHHALSWSDPLTGHELAGPVSRARVPGFDLMFSVPKSASVLFGLGEADVRATIRRAQVEAVEQALGYLEDVACRGRFGAGGLGGSFAGRGFLAAAFEHRTSRAGDPQLHTHVLVANTIQRPDGQWATLDGRLIYAHAKTAGYIHEAAFRRALARDLGVEWRRVVNGIADIRGVSEPVLEAFSRRSREIDAYMRRRGETSAAARQVAAVRTREAKDYAVMPAQLVPEWRERAAALGLDQERVAELVQPGRSTLERLVSGEAIEALLAGRDGLTRGASHFDRRQVLEALAELARQGATRAELEELAHCFLGGDRVIPLVPEEARRSDVLRREDGRIVAALQREQRYTTPEVLAAERKVLRAVVGRSRDRVAVAYPYAVEDVLARRPSIGEDQALMVRRLTTGGEGVQVVVGPAGSGKTFALEAARAVWEASGVPVMGAAVARAAAHVLQDEAGIESTSVAALLRDLRRGGAYGLAQGSVLIVDEAGMLGTFDLAEILDHAAAARAKVVLTGDPHQLPEIDAGGCFRALTRQPGTVVLEQNRRQRHAHDRAKVELLRRGRSSEALAVAGQHGDVVVTGDAEQLFQRIVADYCEAVDDGAVMIAARRSEVAELNARARAVLDQAGRLGDQRIELAGGEFAAGDRVVVKRNDRRLDVQNGNRGRILDVDTKRSALRVELNGGREVVIDDCFLRARGRRAQPSLVHGYAATAHVMQGQTTERAFVLGSDSIYREWGYVAMTRARDRTRFYVCDRDVDGRELSGREVAAVALDRSRAQHTAHELAEQAAVGGLTTADLAAERCRLERVLRDDPTDAERRVIEQLEATLDDELGRLDAATERRTFHESRRTLLLGRPRDPEAVARAAADQRRAEVRIAAVTEELHELRAGGASARWRDLHRDDLSRYGLVVDELDGRFHDTSRGLRHVEPPRYITSALGRRPEGKAPRRTWDRALHAIERYRARHGVNDPWRALGPRPERAQLADWRAAQRELERAAQTLDRGRGIGREGLAR